MGTLKMPTPSTKQTTGTASVATMVVTRSGRESKPIKPLDPTSFAGYGGGEDSARSAAPKTERAAKTEGAEEAARKAAEDEAARLAAEEAARKAAEDEAVRLAAANAQATAETEAAAAASTVQFLRPGTIVPKVSDCIEYGYSTFVMTEILFVQGPVEVAIAECTEGMFIRKKCVVKANKKGPSLQVNDEYCVLTHIWRRNGDISIQFPMSYGRTGDYYVLASEYAGVDLCKIWEKKGAFSN